MSETKTIKSLILEAIRAVLVDVTGINQVITNPFVTVDFETATLPVALIFDEEERKRQSNNLAYVTMPLHVEVWIRAERDDLSERTDLLAGRVESALLGDLGLSGAAAVIVPDPERGTVKFFADEFLGGFVARYVVECVHLWGDPFDGGQ